MRGKNNTNGEGAAEMAVIKSVDASSPAERAGVRAGDELLSIGGHAVRDVLDYKFYGYDAKLDVVVARGGSQRAYHIKKHEGEELGLNFESYLIDKTRRCSNKCVFCFIDQMPPNMRDTLYFKDDDARMSFLLGNYISLTNLSEADVERMVKMRISPVNISVQTTNPALRVKMLGNPRAGESLQIMRRFADARIMMNCQIVVCPGLNDADELRRSLTDLTELFPAVGSISVVPVGLTKYREGLAPLTPMDREKARETIALANAIGEQCLEKWGTRVVYCADEMYLTAGLAVPEPEYYEEYAQLENGVGMMALMEDEFHAALGRMHPQHMKRFTIATGEAAAPYIKRLVDEAARTCDNAEYRVEAIPNDFFGHTVTVAGLVTGQDIAKRLRGHITGDRVLIPANMLRHGGDVFLDDMPLDDLAGQLGVPVIPVENDGAAFLEAIAETM